jgi:hypothetical protein
MPGGKTNGLADSQTTIKAKATRATNEQGRREGGGAGNFYRGPRLIGGPEDLEKGPGIDKV